MLKNFWEISEIQDNELREKFSNFGGLNKVIERNNVSRDEIYKAYVEVLIWELDQIEYTELHFQIKYLLDEVKVAVDSILWFYDCKVEPYLVASINLLENFFAPDKVKNEFKDFLVKGNKSGKIWFIILNQLKQIVDEFIIDKKSMSEEEIYKLLKEWETALNEKLKSKIPVYAWIKKYS